MAMQIRECLQQAYDTLARAGNGEGRLDARVLLCHVLSCPGSYLYSHDDRELDQELVDKYLSVIKERASGVPCAYITGSKEFYGLEFRVSRDTLIPRPDTETLVELAISMAGQHGFRDILDLGTGCGAIAVALAKNLKHASVTACDISEGALDVARENARALGAGVAFVQGSWFDNIKGRYGLIVSNPPYVKEGDPHLEDLSHEPVGALVSGAEGLDDIIEIASQAPGFLVDGGMLMLEHGCDQGERVRAVLADKGYAKIKTVTDLQHRERVTYGIIRS